MSPQISHTQSKNGSQCAQIRHALEQGDKLTPMDALTRFGCSRLAARVNDLKAEGLPVEKTMLDVGNGKIVAEYYLPQEGHKGTVKAGTDIGERDCTACGRSAFYSADTRKKKGRKWIVVERVCECGEVVKL